MRAVRVTRLFEKSARPITLLETCTQEMAVFGSV